MRNSRSRAYYDRPERDRAVHAPFVRYALPIIVLAGACYIPLAATEMSMFWDDVLVLAKDMKTMEGTAKKAIQKQMAADVEKAPTLKAVQQSVRESIPENVMQDLKQEFLKGKDAKEVQRSMRKLSMSVSSGNFSDVPQDLAQRVKNALGADTIRRLKEKIKRMNPSPAQLQQIAMDELVKSGAMSAGEVQDLMASAR